MSLKFLDDCFLHTVNSPNFPFLFFEMQFLFIEVFMLKYNFQKVRNLCNPQIQNISNIQNISMPPERCLCSDFHHHQFSSVTQSCLTLYDPMDCSTPGFLAHHQLLEPVKIHVHRVSDAIQPSHTLSSPSPSAFSLSQHQGLFQ